MMTEPLHWGDPAICGRMTQPAAGGWEPSTRGTQLPNHFLSLILGEEGWKTQVPCNVG